MKKYITTPLTQEKLKDLHSGNEVLLSGVIYTSRDAGTKDLLKHTREAKNCQLT